MSSKMVGRSASPRAKAVELPGVSVLPRRVGRSLDRQPWDQLVPHLTRAGADVGVVMPRLRRFAELLLEWNRGFSNLISTADEGRLVERHILESLEPAAWLESPGRGRWMDFGSGGGFPALPLALAGVGQRWTLVESRRNKSLFLRKVIQEIGLDNVDVELARLESLSPGGELAGGFDAFTSRATLRLGPTLSLASSWVAENGSAYLWKGSRVTEEMAEGGRWRQWWSDSGSIRLADSANSVFRFVRAR
jgi:16S rRNA (guanine527-N7)-methyltransferase